MANTYRVQGYNSIMCGYFYIESIDLMFRGKNLTDFTNLLIQNDFQKMME